MIDFADVLPNHAQADQLHAGHKADDARHADAQPDTVRPSDGLHDGPEHADKADERHDHAEAGDEADGFDGQAGDAVKGQRQHLGQGIVALACNALVALVGLRWST